MRLDETRLKQADAVMETRVLCRSQISRAIQPALLVYEVNVFIRHCNSLVFGLNKKGRGKEWISSQVIGLPQII